MKAFFISEIRYNALRALFYTIIILTFIIAATSCKSPIESDAPRLLTPDVQWKNDGSATSVATIQGQEPDIRLQVQREVGVTNGNLLVTANLTGSYIQSSVLAKFPVVTGKVTLGFAQGMFWGVSNGAVGTIIGGGLWGSGLSSVQMGAAQANIVFDKSLSTSGTISTPAFTLTDSTIVIPEERKLASHIEDQIFDANKDLTLEINKPAEQGMATEVYIYAGGWYMYGTVLKTIPPGTTSARITSAEIQSYLSALPISLENVPYKGVKGNIPMTVSVRVKGAKAVNNGTVSLAGVTVYTMTLIARK